MFIYLRLGLNLAHEEVAKLQEEIDAAETRVKHVAEETNEVGQLK